MLKFKLKGFTLIECIVALAILGIASLSMVQIYANVCAINRSNHDVNTSLMYQMQFVERYSDNNNTFPDEQVIVYADGSIPSAAYTDPKTDKHIKITKIKADGTADTDSAYYFPTDVHVLKSRAFVSADADGEGLDDDESVYGTTDGNYDLRYKYIVGYHIS